MTVLDSNNKAISLRVDASGRLLVMPSGGGSTAANLAIGTRTATSLPITNSNGTGVDIPTATTSLAGTLSAADKVLVDTISGKLPAASPVYSGTLTGGTGVVNLGSNQFVKDAAGNVGIGVPPAANMGLLQAATAPNALPTGNSNVPAGRSYAQFGTGTAGAPEWLLLCGAYNGPGHKAGIMLQDYFLDNGQYGGRYIQAENQNIGFGRVINGAAGSTNATLDEHMRIDGSGQLQLGATSNLGGVSAKLQVQQGASSQAGTFQVNGTGGIQIMFQTASTGGVGSISSTSTTTTYSTTSDYRLKANPLPLQGSGAFIDALQPRTWTWVQDGSVGAGFIAHEFQAVSPASVTGSKDAVDAEGKPVYQSMQASSAEVMANIVAELQALRARVAELESRGN